MIKPKISIIVPIYNAEKYLRKCLDSLVNQTLKDIELILVNDGSKDNTEVILNEYKKKYKNIKVINQQNQGVINARINGLKKASGEYIGWVDADDFVELDMFDKLYAKAVNDNVEVVICNYNFYPKDVINKEKWFKDYNGEVDYKFLINNSVQWNKIVKKELLDRIDAIKLFKLMGESCYTLVLINANGISTISECLYNYRVGHSSLSSNFENINWYEKTVDKAFAKYEYVKNNNYDDKWIEYNYYAYLYYILILSVVYAYNDKRKEYKKYVKIIKKEKLFSKKYNKYLLQNMSYIKIIFFKFLGIHSFTILKIIAKLLLK